MLPFSDLQVRSPGHSDTPTLVLLHVFGGSRREWAEAAVLMASQFRIVSIDTPGFGQAANHPGYSVAEMAEAFRETVSALRLQRIVLVGHSMTAKVAMVLAAQELPGLEKLVLLTPSPITPEPIPDEARKKMLAAAEPDLASAEQYIRDNSELPIPSEIFARAVEDRLRAHPAAWRAWLESGSYEDWSDRISRLDVPALVLAAECDASLGPAVQQKLTMPHLGNGRMEVILGSGHLVPMEAPERLARALCEFAGR